MNMQNTISFYERFFQLNCQYFIMNTILLQKDNNLSINHIFVLQ